MFKYKKECPFHKGNNFDGYIITSTISMLFCVIFECINYVDHIDPPKKFAWQISCHSLLYFDVIDVHLEYGIPVNRSHLQGRDNGEVIGI